MWFVWFVWFVDNSSRGVAAGRGVSVLSALVSFVIQSCCAAAQRSDQSISGVSAASRSRASGVAT